MIFGKKKKGKSSRKHVLQHQGFQERNKEVGPSQTNSSPWANGLQQVSSLSSRPAFPVTPPIPKGWNDKHLYTDNKSTGRRANGELGRPDENSDAID